MLCSACRSSLTFCAFLPSCLILPSILLFSLACLLPMPSSVLGPTAGSGEVLLEWSAIHVGDVSCGGHAWDLCHKHLTRLLSAACTTTSSRCWHSPVLRALPARSSTAFVICLHTCLPPARHCLLGLQHCCYMHACACLAIVHCAARAAWKFCPTLPLDLGVGHVRPVPVHGEEEASSVLRVIHIVSDNEYFSHTGGTIHLS